MIVPAHNEGPGLRRLLRGLTGAPADAGLEVIVVCNGCTDDTADVAGEFAPAVRVIEIPQPSKSRALQVGDAAARNPYRALVDADVVVGRHDLERLVAALSDAILVSSPARVLRLERSSLPVRWYYDVWERLPQVRDGAFGRGVVVLSPEGHARVRALPPVMSDDLAVSEVFGPSERAVVPGAQVTIAAPRTFRDLVRRRIRVATGNAQLDRLGLRGTSARTDPRTLLRIAGSGPVMPLKVGTFAVVAVIARTASRRRVRSGDFTTWLRDESSRGTS